MEMVDGDISKLAAKCTTRKKAKKKSRQIIVKKNVEEILKLRPKPASQRGGKLGKIPMEIPSECSSKSKSRHAELSMEGDADNMPMEVTAQQGSKSKTKRARPAVEKDSGDMPMKVVDQRRSKLKVKRIKLASQDELANPLPLEIPSQGVIQTEISGYE